MFKNMLFATLLLMAVSVPPLAAEPARDFTLATKNGGQVTLSALRGKVVYVDFWATWCPPCRKSFPWLNAMHDRYAKQGLEIVAISIDNAQEPVDRFLKEIPPRFTVATDPDATLADVYGLRMMPTSYLIDRNGDVYATHRGFSSNDTAAVEEEIEKLLAKR